MRRASLLVVAALVWPLPAARAQDEPGGAILSFDEAHEGCATLLEADAEARARALAERVARRRAEGAPDAEWLAASLLPVPTSPAPLALLAALDAEQRRGARHEGPGGRTARYLGFSAALLRHGPRTPAVLTLLQALRPGHPWLRSATSLVRARPALDALVAGWARLDAPDPLAPRVEARVLGRSHPQWRELERDDGPRGGGILTFDDERDEDEEPTRLAAGALVTGADGAAYIVDAALRRWPLAPESTPAPSARAHASTDPAWELLAAARRARRLGDEAGALRAFTAAVDATHRTGPGLVEHAVWLAARNARVAAVDDLARGAPAADVTRRLRALDAVDPDRAGLTERVAGLVEVTADAVPWSRPEWAQLGIEARLEQLTAALPDLRGVVPLEEARSGNTFEFEDLAEKDERIAAPLRPLIDVWAGLGWDGVGALVALLPDARATRVVEEDQLEPWTVGEVAARLFVRLTGADLTDFRSVDGRAAFGRDFWARWGPRGPRAYYLSQLDIPEFPDPGDAHLLLFLRVQPAIATAWLEPRLVEVEADKVVPWAELYARAGVDLTGALEAGLRRALHADDLDQAQEVARGVASDPRFVGELEALGWRLVRANRTAEALRLLRALRRAPSSLVLAAGEGLVQRELDQLPPGPAATLVTARLESRPHLVLAAQVAAPWVQADPDLLLFAVDTLRRAVEERPSPVGLVALAGAVDALPPRLTPEHLGRRPELAVWLHGMYGARAAGGRPGAAAARDAIAAWWSEATTRVAVIGRGPCLPAPLVEPLGTRLDADTLQAALGTLEDDGRLRAQVRLGAALGPCGLQLTAELGPRPDDHAAGWWTLRVDVTGPAGELLSTTEACTAEPTARWARPLLADAVAALRSRPGARLELRASPP